MPHIATDVLIVGSGPAGGSAAALLSSYGVPNLLISRYGSTADTPRAHITNQRTMEVLRDLGIEQAAISQSTGQALMANNVFCYSLAGEEFARVYSWGNHPARKADYELASPTSICDIPQNLLEPILIGTAVRRGGKVRFDTEFLGLEQDADGVTATARDRLTNEIITIRCSYLIGADGARSRVAEQIGLDMAGRKDLSGSMNIVFEADLSRYVAHRPSVLYWILQPGARIGGIGAGVLRMVRPWTEWMGIWGYDISRGEMKLDDEQAEAIVRNMIGDADVPIQIKSTSTWSVNEVYAEYYAKGRVFCAGDAVHRHPPLNGLGSNTSIQDSFNLCWKLKLVLEGSADPALLDSYSLERQPVGRQIVLRANRSMDDYPPIFDALGMLDADGPDAARARMEARKDATPEAAERRRRLHEAVERKNYEFNTHGVELNQRYRSNAVVSDNTAEPAFARDAELYYAPTTYPGARLPHLWVERGGRRLSTLDLVGQGRFTLLTGIGGGGWRAAAASAEDWLGVPIEVVTVGPAGCDAQDIYGDWYRQSEVREDGAILVRPDMHVGWRAQCWSSSAASALAAAMGSILGRSKSAVETPRAAEKVD